MLQVADITQTRVYQELWNRAGGLEKGLEKDAKWNARR